MGRERDGDDGGGQRDLHSLAKRGLQRRWRQRSGEQGMRARRKGRSSADASEDDADGHVGAMQRKG